MVTLNRVRPEKDVTPATAPARSFGSLIVDEKALYKILGLRCTDRCVMMGPYNLLPRMAACARTQLRAPHLRMPPALTPPRPTLATAAVAPELHLTRHLQSRAALRSSRSAATLLS